MRSVADRATPNRYAQLPGTRKRFLTTCHSPIFTCQGINAVIPTQANGAWVSANDPLAIPFTISTPLLVCAFGWKNGSGTMTDSFDMGIYTTAFVRLISGGGTARVGASLWQWVDVTDTLIPPGSYYLAAANNGITANNVTFHAAFAVATGMSFMGNLDSATNAYPLPDPLTNMAAAATLTRVPVMGFATRAVFA